MNIYFKTVCNNVYFLTMLSKLLLFGLLHVSFLNRSHSAPTTIHPTYQALILGITSDGEAHVLPRSTCVSPGQTLRLKAYLVDQNGRNVYIPYDYFTWKITIEDQQPEEWNPKVSYGHGTFKEGDLIETVFFTVPESLETHGRLEIFGKNGFGKWIQIVDPSSQSEENPQIQCQWAPPGVYIVEQGGDHTWRTPRHPRNPYPPCPPGYPYPYPYPYPPTPPSQPGSNIPPLFPPGFPLPEPPPFPGSTPRTPPYMSIVCHGACFVGDLCTDGCPPRGKCKFFPSNGYYPAHHQVLECRPL